MNKNENAMHNRVFLLSIVLLLNTLLGLAQTKGQSTEEKWIDGKRYLMHTVEKGQGLYGIKKIYQVTEKDIIEANPELKDGLKAGQVIKIPAYKSSSANINYKTHQLEEGQTIYAVAKLYQITPEQIFELNPETKTSYKVGQLIKIPQSAQKAETTKGTIQNEKPINNNQVVQKEEVKLKANQYLVKKEDTFYALTQQFKCSQEELVSLNPQLKDGLKLGQVIEIPEVKKIDEQAIYKPVEESQISIDHKIGHICGNKPSSHPNLKIALMLPFEMDINAFLSEQSKSSNEKPRYNEKPFFEFYQGFLLAVKSLKQEGYDLNIKVYNTKRNVDATKTIVKSGELKNMDFIVGPVYKETFQIVQTYADSFNIPIINPILKPDGQYAASNQTIFMMPSELEGVNQSAKIVAHNDTSAILLVHSGSTADAEMLREFENSYKNSRNTSAPNYKVQAFQGTKYLQFKSHLIKGKHNFIVLLSENQAFVSNVMTQLNILSKEYDIQILGRPKWHKFENISAEYYHNLNMLMVSSEFVDYQSDSVKSFVRRYRTEFNSEPTRYSFLGFDILYNISHLFQSEHDVDCVSQLNTEGFGTGFSFEKTKNGWMNGSVYFLQYDKEFVIRKALRVGKTIQKY